MARKGNSAAYGSEPQRELAKILRGVSDRHGLWQVWRDFVAMSALSLSNAADRSQAAAREAEYLQIVSRYERDEVLQLARGFSCVVAGLEAGHQDFLGSLFMALELADAWKGQFFTPYALCLCMAKMNLSSDHVRELIERKGFVAVNDPCTGGGAMVLAAAHALEDEGINYQRHMHVVAQDIDIVAVHMSYVQLSLRHIPAVVVHGNSLKVETLSVWRTLAHVMGRWDAKLDRARQHESEVPSRIHEMPVREEHQSARVDIASADVQPEASEQFSLF